MKVLEGKTTLEEIIKLIELDDDDYYFDKEDQKALQKWAV